MTVQGDDVRFLTTKVNKNKTFMNTQGGASGYSKVQEM